MPSWVEQLPICWGGLIGWLVGGLLGTLIDVGRMAAHPGTCNPSLASAPLGGACALSFFFSLITGLLFGSSELWSLWVLLGTLGPLFANQALHVDALLRAHIPYGLHPAFYVAFLTLLVALGGTASRVASLLEQMLPAPTEELPENDTPRKARVDDPPSFLDIRVRDDNEHNKDEDDVFDEEDLPASATVAPPHSAVGGAPFIRLVSRLGEAGTTLSATLVTWGLMNILPLVIVLLAVQPTPETTKVWTDAGRNLPAEYDEVVLQVQLWAGVIAFGLGLMLFALFRPARHIGVQGPARSHATVDPWRARSSPQKGRRPHRSKRRKP